MTRLTLYQLVAPFQRALSQSGVADGRMVHVVRNDQLDSADLAFLPLFFAISIIELYYICLKGLAQSNEGQVE